MLTNICITWSVTVSTSNLMQRKLQLWSVIPVQSSGAHYWMLDIINAGMKVAMSFTANNNASLWSFQFATRALQQVPCWYIIRWQRKYGRETTELTAVSPVESASQFYSLNFANNQSEDSQKKVTYPSPTWAWKYPLVVLATWAQKRVLQTFVRTNSNWWRQ